MIHLWRNQSLENVTSDTTIARHDLVTKFVISLTTCEITQSYSKLQRFKGWYPLRSTFRRGNEKCGMCFVATVQRTHHLEDTPSSISVSSVARLGTKIGVWISSICVQTTRGHDHNKVWFLYVSVYKLLMRVSSGEYRERSEYVRWNRFHSFAELCAEFCLHVLINTWMTRRWLRHRRPINPDVPTHEKET